jgi:hypothetical protein
MIKVEHMQYGNITVNPHSVQLIDASKGNLKNPQLCSMPTAYRSCQSWTIFGMIHLHYENIKT